MNFYESKKGYKIVTKYNPTRTNRKLITTISRLSGYFNTRMSLYIL